MPQCLKSGGQGWHGRAQKMEEDSLDKITNLIEAEEHDHMTMNDSNFHIEKQKLFQKKPFDKFNAFKRLHNFALPSTKLFNWIETPIRNGHIEIKNTTDRHVNTTDVVQKQTDGRNSMNTNSSSTSCNESNNQLIGELNYVENDLYSIEKIDESSSCNVGVQNQQILSNGSEKMDTSNRFQNIRNNLNIMEQRFAYNGSTIHQQELQIVQLTKANDEQKALLSDAIQEITDAQLLLDSQMHLLKEQQSNLIAMSRIKQEMQSHIHNIEDIMEENKHFINDTNDKIMKLVDECQHWKISSVKFQRELVLVENKCNFKFSLFLDKHQIEEFDQKSKEQQQEHQLALSDVTKEKERITKENELIQTEKQALSQSYIEINSNFRDISVKIKRIIDDARVEYSTVVENEEDIEKIFFIIENFHRDQNVQNRKMIRNLEIELEQIKGDMLRREKDHIELHRYIQDLEERNPKNSEIEQLKTTINGLQDEKKINEEMLLISKENYDKVVIERNNFEHALEDAKENLKCSKEHECSNLEDKITTLKKELEKKSANVTECLRLKNAEIENIKKHFQTLLTEKDVEIENLLKRKQLEPSTAKDDVAEIIHDIGLEISKQQVTPPQQRTKQFMQVESKRSKKTFEKFNHLNAVKKKLNDDKNETSSCTASLTHYAKRHSNSQRKLVSPESDDYFQ